jgi:hypothetical protein
MGCDNCGRSTPIGARLCIPCSEREKRDAKRALALQTKTAEAEELRGRLVKAANYIRPFVEGRKRSSTLEAGLREALRLLEG